MEKPATIREILGFTQEELALVLNVNRMQIAKYELGIRNLPIPTMYLLAELLKVAQSPELLAKNLPALVQQNTQKQQLLERLLKENQYQIELVVRKMTTAEKKYNARVKVLQLVDQLTHNLSDKHTVPATTLNAIARKAAKGLESEGLGTLFQYKLRYELLVSENMLLQAELRKHLKALEVFETE